MTIPIITIEDGNDRSEFPETIPPILLCASWLTGYGASEMIDKFVYGAESLDKCDDLVTKINKMGLADVVKVQHAAKDRYYEVAMSAKVKAA
ncbi:hypothetical protein OB236_09445 [Paenibacillus sp. WQ 127069]|uniref:Uncharacterized protein n=1 Tax=Paenibacillus baimaensis TaxID=2982185 RepID=A0ABT2UDZ6_9BACL|nr:hypothetical protein [Paenibacillus sp. WQ 127069]MCU6792351.1 hypothetical protein [Paenibacillus sp. WQ 127069]